VYSTLLPNVIIEISCYAAAVTTVQL